MNSYQSKLLSLTGPLVLIIFAYLFIFFKVSNFENTWMHPETVRMKAAYLQTGPYLVSQDFFKIWDWRINEVESRTTRWVSWHLDFLDTKFRVWLWRFLPPHPSFSLTWLWILVLNPWLLFIYLRLRRFSVGISLTVTAFYLMTPASLSGLFMLFRSGKILANFFMLGALIFAFLSETNRQKKLYFVGFCLSLLLGVFSDETAFFIFPILFFLHFRFIFRHWRWLGVLLTLFLILIAYGWGIQEMCHRVSGAPLIGLKQYRFFNHIFEGQFASQFMSNIGFNTLTLFTQTMGLALPHPLVPVAPKVLWVLGLLAWSIMAVMMLMCKDFWNKPFKIFFPWIALFFLSFLFHDFLMSMVDNQIWGPYYYGNYFSILFSLALASFLRFVMPEDLIRAVFMGIIICLMGTTFLYTNKAYKKHHFYPYSPLNIRSLFNGEAKYFDPNLASDFSDKELKGYIKSAWKAPHNVVPDGLPGELNWLPVELNVFKN